MEINQFNASINIVIIYHDCLPTPRKGSHIKSDKTHTVIKIHPLALILDCWASIFSSCALLTVYPNRIMQWHPSNIHLITTRAWEGCPKEHRAKQKWLRETHSVTYVPGLSTLSGLSRIVGQPPPSFLCCLKPLSRGREDDLSFFEYLSPFCFLSIEFHCTTFCLLLLYFG